MFRDHSPLKGEHTEVKFPSQVETDQSLIIIVVVVLLLFHNNNYCWSGATTGPSIFFGFTQCSCMLHCKLSILHYKSMRLQSRSFVVGPFLSTVLQIQHIQF